MSQSSLKSANKDRISRLPDELLCRILSFLPTKYAVSTSILSSRWRYLWTWLPSVDFDDQLKLNHAYFRTSKELEDSFVNFVERVLSHGSLPFIKRLYLRTTRDYDPSRVSAWISAAIMCNVEELDVYIKRTGVVFLPQCLFSCEKLVVLKLGSPFFLNVPESVCFPNLKVLHLKSVPSLDDTSFKKILSGSPYLEDLVIDRKEYVDDVKNLNVDSLSLKSLTIRTAMEEYEGLEPYGVVVNAPKLEFLELVDYQCGSFNMEMVPLLVRANVDVGRHLFYYKEPPEYGDRVIQLLRQISNVKALCLSWYTGVALYNAAGINWPSFLNLTHLEVGIVRTGWAVLIAVLKLAPNLEILVFDPLLPEDYKYDYSLDPLQSVPRCLLLCLQVVKFKIFYGHPLEMVMVEYFLKNAMVLRKMKISCITGGLKYKLDVVKKLLMFPRVSSACQIEFS